MPYPKLGHRAIDAYNRLARECAAYNYVLRHTRQSGPVSWQTLMALNGMIILANRLFRRHADLPRFLPVEPHLRGDRAQDGKLAAVILVQREQLDQRRAEQRRRIEAVPDPRLHSDMGQPQRGIALP